MSDKKIFDIIKTGLFYMSACTNMTDLTPEEAESWANSCNPPGTQNGWMLSKDKTFATGQPHPCPCPDHKGRIHLLFEA